MSTDTLSQVFSALADPTRRAILERLADGPATVTELAEPFAISVPAVSKHLKVLENAGLMTVTRVAQSRPRTLDPEPLAVAADWVEAMRQAWEAQHDHLATYLIELQEKQKENTDE